MTTYDENAPTLGELQREEAEDDFAETLEVLDEDFANVLNTLAGMESALNLIERCYLTEGDREGEAAEIADAIAALVTLLEIEKRAAARIEPKL